MEDWRREALRNIPSVTAILGSEIGERLIREYFHATAAGAAGETAGELRRKVMAASAPEDLSGLDFSAEGAARSAAARVEAQGRPSLRRAINATGVVLHTNLGRSPLAGPAVDAVASVAAGYSNLELDLATGERGSRYSHVEEILCRLTGSESAMAVNNNAGAVLLVLSAIARGREVVVSRGELVEIGGAFRVPEVMEQSGAILREVGTTNKTRLSDYERAVDENTAALMKVHTSNYRIVGFSESVPLADLVELGRERGLPVIEDLGSGVLVDLARYGLASEEPRVQDSVAAGAGLVTFSGDKLLGGPQAGIIVGKKALLDRVKKHPLARALRIDKLTLAALEATLKLYLDPDKALIWIPTLRMLTAPASECAVRSRHLAADLASALGDRARVEVTEGFSQAGGGSLPGVDLPTTLVALSPSGKSAAQVEAALRGAPMPVLARIQKDQILLDPRTIGEGEEDLVVEAFLHALPPDGSD